MSIVCIYCRQASFIIKSTRSGELGLGFYTDYEDVMFVCCLSAVCLLFVCLSVCLFVCLSFCLCMCLFVFVHVFVSLSVYLFVCLFVVSFVPRFVCLSVCLCVYQSYSGFLSGWFCLFAYHLDHSFRMWQTKVGRGSYQKTMAFLCRNIGCR